MGRTMLKMQNRKTRNMSGAMSPPVKTLLPPYHSRKRPTRVDSCSVRGELIFMIQL